MLGITLSQIQTFINPIVPFFNLNSSCYSVSLLIVYTADIEVDDQVHLEPKDESYIPPDIRLIDFAHSYLYVSDDDAVTTSGPDLNILNSLKSLIALFEESAA